MPLHAARLSATKRALHTLRSATGISACVPGCVGVVRHVGAHARRAGHAQLVGGAARGDLARRAALIAVTRRSAGALASAASGLFLGDASRSIGIGIQAAPGGAVAVRAAGATAEPEQTDLAVPTIAAF